MNCVTKEGAESDDDGKLASYYFYLEFSFNLSLRDLIHLFFFHIDIFSRDSEVGSHVFRDGSAYADVEVCIVSCSGLKGACTFNQTGSVLLKENFL